MSFSLIKLRNNKLKILFQMLNFQTKNLNIPLKKENYKQK